MPADVYVNVQGDEPLMPAENVDRAVETLLAGAGRGIATLALPAGGRGRRAIPNTVKVAVAADGRALYFSRSPIPFFRNGEPAYGKHLGIYAYRARRSAEIAALPPSPLERAESLEQLRWLEAGYTIWVGDGGRGLDRRRHAGGPGRGGELLQKSNGGWKKEAVA